MQVATKLLPSTFSKVFFDFSIIYRNLIVVYVKGPAVIKRETEVVETFLTPELQLHLITEKCRLWTSKSADPFTDPFWAFYWPGGQGIARYILDNPNVVSKKKVLDFGSGCGACGLAAKLGNAKFVKCNDIDLVSSLAIQMNADLNNIRIDEICTNNLIGLPVEEDILLIGDMLYDGEFALQLVNWIKMLLKQNKTLLLGDPGRAFLSILQDKFMLQKLASYTLHDITVAENNGFPVTCVYSVK